MPVGIEASCSMRSCRWLTAMGARYSVESGLTGQTDHHAQRCELLKLKIPEPRNWARNTKDYKSYGDFLKYLDEIARDPESFYSDIRRDCGDNETSLFANDASSTPSSSDESFDSKVQPHAKSTLKAGSKKPSLSDLLCKDKPKQATKSSGANHDVRNQKYLGKSGIDGKTPTEDWTFGLTPARPKKRNKDFIVHSHGANKKLSVPPLRRMSLREGAAIVIQATYRGYRVRKDARKAATAPERGSEPSKKLTLDNMFLHVKSNSDWEYGSDAGPQRSRRKIPAKTTLARSSSNESNESIISVREGPAYRKKHLISDCDRTILLCGGVNPMSKRPSAREACQVYMLTEENNYWDKLDTMPSPRYYHGSAILQGKVYIVGGCNPDYEDNGSSAISNDNFSYDIACGVWSKEPQLNTPRRSFGLVSFIDHLYAIGGQDKDDTILSSVERYDLERKVWEEVKPLPQPTIGAAICVYKNQIWVAGGMSGSNSCVSMSKDVWCYDPRQDVWTKKPPLRFGRAFAALGTFEDYLVLVGGITCDNNGTVIVSNDSIDIWDGENKMWKLKGNVDLPRHGHSIAFLGSLMLLIGGVTSKNVKGLTQIETQCLLRGTRPRNIAPLPTPLVGHSTVLYD